MVKTGHGKYGERVAGGFWERGVLGNFKSAGSHGEERVLGFQEESCGSSGGPTEKNVPKIPKHAMCRIFCCSGYLCVTLVFFVFAAGKPPGGCGSVRAQ